jgi:regulatory factor X 1/2/3
VHTVSFYYIIQAFLDAVVNLEFQTVESLWREFWRNQDNNNGDECEEEKYLSKYV